MGLDLLTLHQNPFHPLRKCLSCLCTEIWVTILTRARWERSMMMMMMMMMIRSFPVHLGLLVTSGPTYSRRRRNPRILEARPKSQSLS
jgi:hypothetical protein